MQRDPGDVGVVSQQSVVGRRLQTASAISTNYAKRNPQFAVRRWLGVLGDVRCERVTCVGNTV